MLCNTWWWWPTCSIHHTDTCNVYLCIPWPGIQNVKWPNKLHPRLSFALILSSVSDFSGLACVSEVSHSCALFRGALLLLYMFTLLSQLCLLVPDSLMFKGGVHSFAFSSACIHVIKVQWVNWYVRVTLKHCSIINKYTTWETKNTDIVRTERPGEAHMWRALGSDLTGN